MDVDYDQMAPGYDAHRQGGGPYLDTLLRLAEQSAAARVLELGAGTGNNTAAFSRRSACAMTALDPSQGMLERARAKKLPVRYVRGAAEHLPFAANTFEFVFGVYMLHYVADLEALFRECRRVLDSGCAAFVTAPHAFIRRHPMNAYFQSFAEIDLARFQPESQIREAFRAAGFSGVTAEHLVAEPQPIDHAYVERIAGKFISTYALLPPAEFERGLARLRHDIGRKGQLDTPMMWETLIVSGRVDQEK
jgi:SAM-dependent methyltransferase